MGSGKFQFFETLPSRSVVLCNVGVMHSRSALACQPFVVCPASARRQGVWEGAVPPRGYSHMDATELRLAEWWLLEDGKKQTEARHGLVSQAIVVSWLCHCPAACSRRMCSDNLVLLAMVWCPCRLHVRWLSCWAGAAQSSPSARRPSSRAPRRPMLAGCPTVVFDCCHVPYPPGHCAARHCNNMPKRSGRARGLAGLGQARGLRQSHVQSTSKVRPKYIQSTSKVHPK